MTNFLLQFRISCERLGPAPVVEEVVCLCLHGSDEPYWNWGDVIFIDCLFSQSNPFEKRNSSSSKSL